jgi:hypothetical protein
MSDKKILRTPLAEGEIPNGDVREALTHPLPNNV